VIEGVAVPSWAVGLVVLVTTFGPGAAAVFFTRWLKRQDSLAAALKSVETEKLDQVLGIAKRLETEVGSLTHRLSISDALQNQLKGNLDKVEERINGIGSTYGRRLGELEALIQRLDERTREWTRSRRGKG
jgi:hypothetical protein